MRRNDREVLDEVQIADIMSRCEVLRLGINTDTVPYLLPVNFGMEPDGMTLYIHGAATGTKYGYLEKDPRVSFEMDCTYGLCLDEEDHSCSVYYESVIGWGVVEELRQETEKRHALKMLMGHYHAEDFPYGEGPLPRTRVLRLKVHGRSAKRSRKLV